MSCKAFRNRFHKLNLHKNGLPAKMGKNVVLLKLKKSSTLKTLRYGTKLVTKLFLKFQKKLFMLESNMVVRQQLRVRKN